jgi:hypothetical protein
VCQAERKIVTLEENFDLFFAFDGEHDGDYLYVSKKSYSDASHAQVERNYFHRKYGENDLFIYFDVYDLIEKVLLKSLKQTKRKHDMFDEPVKQFYEKISNFLSGKNLDCNVEVLGRLFPEETQHLRGKIQGKKFNF